MCENCHQPLFYDPEEDRDYCPACRVDQEIAEHYRLQEIKEEMRRFYLN